MMGGSDGAGVRAAARAGKTRDMTMRGAIAAAAVIAGFGLLACSPGGEGEKLFKKRCGVCHPIARAEEKLMAAEEWATTVGRMREHGAELTDQEAELVVRYLSKTYGK